MYSKQITNIHLLPKLLEKPIGLQEICHSDHIIGPQGVSSTTAVASLGLSAIQFNEADLGNNQTKKVTVHPVSVAYEYGTSSQYSYESPQTSLSSPSEVGKQLQHLPHHTHRASEFEELATINQMLANSAHAHETLGNSYDLYELRPPSNVTFASVSRPATSADSDCLNNSKNTTTTSSTIKRVNLINPNSSLQSISTLTTLNEEDEI